MLVSYRAAVMSDPIKNCLDFDFNMELGRIAYVKKEGKEKRMTKLLEFSMDVGTRNYD